MDEQRIYRAALAAWGADAQTLMNYAEVFSKSNIQTESRD